MKKFNSKVYSFWSKCDDRRKRDFGHITWRTNDRASQLDCISRPNLDACATYFHNSEKLWSTCMGPLHRVCYVWSKKIKDNVTLEVKEENRWAVLLRSKKDEKVATSIGHTKKMHAEKRSKENSRLTDFFQNKGECQESPMTTCFGKDPKWLRRFSRTASGSKADTC